MLDRDLSVGIRLLDDRSDVCMVGIFEDVADPAVPLALLIGDSAGGISLYGEIQQIDQADLWPLDVWRMGVQSYDITYYQPLLFCAEGFNEIEEVVKTSFAEVDDDMVERLMQDASVPA